MSTESAKTAFGSALERLATKVDPGTLATLMSDSADPAKATENPSARVSIRKQINTLRARRNRDVREHIAMARLYDPDFHTLSSLTDGISNPRQKFDSVGDLLHGLRDRDPEFAAIFRHYQDLEKYIKNGTYIVTPDNEIRDR